jgi:hypothetical protein
LTHERDKLLQAYYAEAVPRDVFRCEQERITRSMEKANGILGQRDYKSKAHRRHRRPQSQRSICGSPTIPSVSFSSPQW